MSDVVCFLGSCSDWWRNTVIVQGVGPFMGVDSREVGRTLDKSVSCFNDIQLAFGK